MGLLVGVEETDDKVDLQKKFIGVSIASNKENNTLLHFPTSQKKKKKEDSNLIVMAPSFC